LLRLWRATINSRNGLVFAVRSEQAIREELVALAISIPLAWLVGATVMRRVELVAAVVMVLFFQRRIVAGLTAGVVVALASGRFIAALLFGISPRDTATIATAMTVLLGAAVIASLGPARRAMRLDPAEVLRAE